MNKKTSLLMLLVTCLVIATLGISSPARAQGEIFHLPLMQPEISADGTTLANIPPVITYADFDPAMQNISIPEDVTTSRAVGSTFQFTFIPAGGKDYWHQTCGAFPAAAKTAFNKAASYWAAKLKSNVVIKIQACWANLGSPTILGYSGALGFKANFAGAPKTNTWYEYALANALHGSDLNTSSADDGITFNSGFAWYFGTNGVVPAGKYDLVSVAAHEIGHGLNFSGMMEYSSGQARYGLGSGLPSTYDRFMENSTGKKLTSFVNPSVALGNLVKSNNLWFNGTYSKAANGGKRVKIYAPAIWSTGSSYSHLDYDTFKGTINSLMVYAIAPHSSQHNLGPVTLAMLKDMGWKLMP